MRRFNGSSLHLGLFWTLFLVANFTITAINATTFSARLKSKLQETIQKLTIPDSIKTQMLNSPDLNNIMEYMNLDGLSIPYSVQDEMLKAIDVQGIMKNMFMDGLLLPKSVREELEKTVNVDGEVDGWTVPGSGGDIADFMKEMSVDGLPFIHTIKDKLPENTDDEDVLGSLSWPLAEDLPQSTNLEDVIQNMTLSSLSSLENAIGADSEGISIDDILTNVTLDGSPIPDSIRRQMLKDITTNDRKKRIKLDKLPVNLGQLMKMVSESAKKIQEDSSEGDINAAINQRFDELSSRVHNLERRVLELLQRPGVGNPVGSPDGNSNNGLSSGKGVCPKDFARNPITGNCYLFSNDSLNWDDARKACFRRGAGLVSIETLEEYITILHYISKKMDEPIDFYTSGNDLNTKFKFVWDSTGHQLTYIAWAPNEPSGGTERCLEIKYYTAYTTYYWNDVPCLARQNYICETKPHPTIAKVTSTVPQ